MSGAALIRRLLLVIPSLLGISVVLYGVLALAPGDPLGELVSNPNVPPAVADALRRQFGLDDPIWLRYIHWLGAMLRGDWGFSFASRMNVDTLILQRVPTTLAVIGAAQLLAICVAVPVGVLAASRPYSIFDQVANTVAFIGFSLPTFFTGLVLILIFSIRLDWLPFVFRTDIPATGLHWWWEQFKQSIMPVTVLGLFQGAALVRFVRSSVLDVIKLEYVTTARSKGIGERRVMLRHVVRNALIPVVTLVALQLPVVFGGAIITEQIFRIPGIGSLLITSILTNDTPVVMGVTFVFAALVILFNLIADLLYGWLDPASLSAEPVLPAAPAVRRPASPWRESWRRFRKHRLAVVSLVVITVMVAGIAAGPFLWRVPIDEIDFSAQLALPSHEHPLGTDDLGQDLLARMIYGGRISLAVGLAAMAVAVVMGLLVGAVAGMASGRIDAALMWLTDLFLSLPQLPLLLLVIYLFRNALSRALGLEAGLFVLIVLVIGGLRWMPVARLVRAQFLSLREKEFVEAAQALGASKLRLVVRHIMPNAMGPVIVAGTVEVANAVIAESTLSFLGLGFPPDTPTWGRMLFSAKDYLEIAPHFALFPGAAIFLAVLSVNFIGDGLRDAFDARRVV